MRTVYSLHVSPWVQLIERLFILTMIVLDNEYLWAIDKKDNDISLVRRWEVTLSFLLLQTYCPSSIEYVFLFVMIIQRYRIKETSVVRDWRGMMIRSYAFLKDWKKERYNAITKNKTSFLLYLKMELNLLLMNYSQFERIDLIFMSLSIIVLFPVSIVLRS